jgi:Na+/H+ antiporter NhaD/arsenite permease-like protein
VALIDENKTLCGIENIAPRYYRTAAGWMLYQYANVLSVLILVLTLLLIISEKMHRTVATMIGATLVVVLGVLPPEEFLKVDGPIHWEALGLIFGMFVMVTVLQDCGFFRWVGLHVLMAARFEVLRIFFFFSLMAGFLAAFMDSVTVLLFMGAMTLEITRILRISPIPFIMAEITSANIGGGATMVGDPPNIIIGTTFHFNFVDFIVNIAPISVLILFINLLFFLVYYKKFLLDTKVNSAEFYKVYKYLKPPPKAAIKKHRDMWVVLTVFIFTLVLLIFSSYMKISVALIGIGGAILCMIFGGRDLPETIDRIDWRTILFFACFFIIVGGLEYTGVIGSMASGIGTISGGNPIIMITVILWLGAFLACFVDNVPVVAMFIPVIQHLHDTFGVGTGILAWTTCLACDVGGNASPIGGSANVVGISVQEKGGVTASWYDYCKVAVPVTMLSLGVVNVVLIVKFMFWGG